MAFEMGRKHGVSQQAAEQMREGISHMVKDESQPLPDTSFGCSG